MVVFTCQHCSDALKKNVVSKHYAIRCRNTPYLTCVDCLKDFRGDDYLTHNTCVTEDERYGDKNFKPKPTGVKQTAWMDVVHSCAQRNENPRLRFFFSKLDTYDNVPRKRVKFMNFVKSAMPSFNPGISNDIFEVIEHAFLNEKKTASSEQSNHDKSVESHNEFAGAIQVENDAENIDKKKKKKKKKKSSDNNESSEVVPDTVQEEIIIKKNKSKKFMRLSPAAMDAVESGDIGQIFNVNSKKNSQKNGFLDEASEQLEGKENIQDNRNSTEVNHEENGTSHENIEKLSKKELKKLKKKQKYEAELKIIEESNNVDCPPEDTNEEIVDNDDGLTKRSKKQKKRKAAHSESEDNTGKRLKAEDIEEMEDSTKDENDDEKKQDKGKFKFNWEEVIKEVLRKSSDQEMSVKRIAKKVLAEYQAVKGNKESYEQLISKFNKKINKTIGVRVLKDRAKLIPDE